MIRLIKLRRVAQTPLHKTRVMLERLQRLSLKPNWGFSWLLPTLCLFATLAIIWQCISAVNFLNYYSADSTPLNEPKRATTRAYQLDPGSYPGLFGLYIADDLSTKQVKDSGLAVTLIGIGYADKPLESVVILRFADGKDHFLHVGDLLPFGAKIISVRRTEVLIERQNMLEKLILNKD